MKCSYCNSELPENSRFCDNCGQEVSTQINRSGDSNTYWDDYQAKATKADKEYQVLVQQENDKLKGKRKKIIAAVISVVLIIASIVCIKVFREKKMESIIYEAEALAASDNYESAYKLVHSSLDTYPNSKVMQQKVEEYAEGWISSTLLDAGLLAKGGDYEGALDMINTRLSTFPDSEELQEKANVYKGELNKQFCKTYSGTYDAGVERGFDLEIISCDYNGHIDAIFSFYSIDESEKLFGSYRMEGDIVSTLNDGSIVASLAGTGWINQPGSYYMIDFEIAIDADKKQLTSEDYEIRGVAVDPIDYSDIVKTFSGTYKPSWGVTGLDIIIRSCDDTGHITAEFSFYPTNQNSSAKKGRYSMIGRVAQTYSDGSLRVDLVSNEWIESPGGMVMMLDVSIIINAERNEAYSDDYQIKLAG